MARNSVTRIGNLPVDLLVKIYSSVTDSVSSLLALSSVSKFMRSILQEHEGAIVWNITAEIIDTNEPGDIRLALMAAEVRFVDRQSHKMFVCFVILSSTTGTGRRSCAGFAPYP
jgi:hypothetical protein